jgi:hypothetical protein
MTGVMLGQSLAEAYLSHREQPYVIFGVVIILNLCSCVFDNRYSELKLSRASLITKNLFLIKNILM